MKVSRFIFGAWAALGLLSPPVARAADFDLARASIADINAAIAAGALTSERLLELYLARIAAYEEQGPTINAIIALHPDARTAARALDAERRATGPRSPLHGIPVVVKDNIDSIGLPCTGGSIFLEGNQPAADAFIVRRLREAGAIILAKVNLGDFASDATGRSSLGGQTRNPHNPRYTPAGSSGGTGAAVGAWFAPLGLGTDTGGSLRSPTSVNGLAGLKPTHGLLSRAGNIPTCLCFDAPGPMARTVHDVAVALGVMAGPDPADPATAASAGLHHHDYTKFLDRGALRGARLGVMRDVQGLDPEIDALFEAALADLRRLGAVLIDPVAYPAHVLGARAGLVKVICDTEVPEEFDRYFASLAPGFPHSFAELVRRADAHLASRTDQSAPLSRVYQHYKTRVAGGPPRASLTYRSARDDGLAMMRAAVLGLYEHHRLDAMVYCTRANRPDLVGVESARPTPGAPTTSVRDVANVTGFPDLIVPAGATADGLPVSLSFIGPAFSEPRLLAYGYAYEQATQRRPIAAATPPLPGEAFKY
jgi:amidase